ncbi:GPI mannosyltransferase 2 [Drosophila santomea]|uniref:GPI mannosyltransferase 2 n=1 Tax=Drosophila santomea TaxID=129105 RepID=UPI001954418F|nr:GPI mannosyltransferase 2 [Drosophila santomea]XP_039481205.1 GPI mannosyltransferase 2 [Drosophila santomea]
MTEKVTKLALASRLIVLLVQLVANGALPEHRPDVFRMPVSVEQNASWIDKMVKRSLGGLRHWDGEYFLHIAGNLYSYENTLAFYPLYPVVVRHVAQAVEALGISLSQESILLVVAVVLNLWLFCESANLLFQLTQVLFNDLNKSWNAALIYCFNPATIFFTAAYSESFFAYSSLHLMLECVKPTGSFRYLRLGIALAACLVCRSNGLITLGYPLYFFARHLLLKNKESNSCLQLTQMTLTILGAIGILHTYYFYIYRLYCLPSTSTNHPQHVVDYAEERKYLLSGQGSEGSPWCQYTLPFPYTYVQSHYWDVGFLRYYKWKQLPNFLLALPMLSFMHWHCYDYIRHLVETVWAKLTPSGYKELLRDHTTFPFVLHAALLTLVCTVYVHIQVSTRLLASATPVFYWFAADHMPKTLAQLKLRSKAGALFVWCTSYSLVGTVLFSNNYPWT